MKPTTKHQRKASATTSRLGLLAAVSGFALVGAITNLSAQSIGETSGFSTAGIPIGDDVYGTAGAGLQPIGVGPAARPSGVQAVGASKAPELGVPVRRGRWTTSVTPYAEATVTYSDNINLDSSGNEQDETILTATAGVTLGAQNERIVGQLTYAASYDTFLNETNEDGFRHNLATNWSAAVVPNLFYIDAQGGVSETYTTSDRFSGNGLANSDERSRAFFGAISPSLRKNIGGWADAEVRYTLRGEAFDDDQEGGYSQQISAGITGDPRKFRRFGWQAATEYEVYTPEDDSTGDDLTRWTSYASVDVPVSRTFAVTGTVGYDHFSEDIAEDDVSGLFANAGVRWQPNTRFAARAFGGWRYDGVDFGAEANYALRKNLVAGLQARRGVQFSNFAIDSASPISTVDNTGRPAFVTAGGGTTTNLDDALAIDNLTGQLGNFGEINRTDQDDDAIVDTLQAFVSGQTGKTSWNANVQAANYDYGSSFGSDELIVSANADVSRALTSRLAATAGIGFTAVQYEDAAPGTALLQNDFETLSLGLGLEYQLTEIVNVFGRYTYTKRFADLPQDEFTENSGVVGVRASF